MERNLWQNMINHSHNWFSESWKRVLFFSGLVCQGTFSLVLHISLYPGHLRTQVILDQVGAGGKRTTLLWFRLGPQFGCSRPRHLSKQSTMDKDHRSQANGLVQARLRTCGREQRSFATLQQKKCSRCYSLVKTASWRRILNLGDSTSAHQFVVLRIKWVLKSRSG